MRLGQVGRDAVVVEADAIKNRDAILRHLSSLDSFDSDKELSAYVHEYSTKAAEAMLVAAGATMLQMPCLGVCCSNCAMSSMTCTSEVLQPAALHLTLTQQHLQASIMGSSP